MTEVTEARISEMKEQIRLWQVASIRQMNSNGHEKMPDPPVFSHEEIVAMNAAMVARLDNEFIDLFGGQDAYDKHTAQQEAKALAKLEADRSIAIVQTSVVEEHLRAAVERYFPGKDIDHQAIERMFDPMKYGPLGTFNARVDIAFALGIIGKSARQALKTISSIRNLFAHRLDIHLFDHPDVLKLIDKLTYINFAMTGPDDEGLVYLWQRDPHSEIKAGCGWLAEDKTLAPRERFEKSCEFFQDSLSKTNPAIRHPDLHEE